MHSRKIRYGKSQSIPRKDVSLSERESDKTKAVKSENVQGILSKQKRKFLLFIR